MTVEDYSTEAILMTIHVTLEGIERELRNISESINQGADFVGKQLDINGQVHQQIIGKALEDIALNILTKE